MKNGKTPNMTVKKFLQSKGITKEKSNDYLVVKNTSNMLLVVHKESGDSIQYEKAKGW